MLESDMEFGGEEIRRRDTSEKFEIEATIFLK